MGTTSSPDDMEDLRRLDPAFDVVPFGECSQKGCVVLRHPDHGLLLATDDPFSAEQEAWAAERLTGIPAKKIVAEVRQAVPA